MAGYKNAGQKYCRMPQREHSAAILSTFIKLPFVIKIFVLSIFEWPHNTGFTVHQQIKILGNILVANQMTGFLVNSLHAG